MDFLRPPTKIAVGKSQIANVERGVIAVETIIKDERIESCPLILFKYSSEQPLLAGVLARYVFHLADEEDTFAFALGYGSLYNHSYKPNARYLLRERNIIDFIALQNIDSGDEITVNYNYGDPDNKSTIVGYDIPPFEES